MKFAFFIDELGNGGAERVTTLLANYFAERQHTVFLYVTNKHSKVGNYTINKRIKIVEVPYSDNKIVRVVKRFLYTRKQLIENSVDACFSLTYTFAPYIVAINRKYRGKFISSLRNAPQYENVGKGTALLRYGTFLFSDAIVFQTEQAREYFPEYIARKGVVIPNPLSENLPLNKDYSNKRVIMVCRLEPQKNIHLALNAFRKFVKKNSDWIMEIYGQGTLSKELERMLFDDLILRDKVYLKGFSNCIHDVMAEGGIYLCSSDFEGLSNSLIEAMAIGLPVISTDCPIGGAQMVIKNGVNGILVDVGDEEGMVYALEFLAKDDGTREKLGRNAIDIRKELSYDIICAKWEKLV